jgi:hypothetical protein
MRPCAIVEIACVVTCPPARSSFRLREGLGVAGSRPRSLPPKPMVCGRSRSTGNGALERITRWRVYKGHMLGNRPMSNRL